LGEDGRPTRTLRKALALAKQGFDIRILPEEELLARLHRPSGLIQRHSTLRELARLIDVSPDRLTAWLRAGLIKPVATVDGIHFFDFFQVAGAKTLCELMRSGVTAARLRQSLRQLRSWLGDIEPPLAHLTTLEHGARLVVRLDNGQLAEPSGQLLFDFSPAAADPSPMSLPWSDEMHTPVEWSAMGNAAEARSSWGEAERAYRQALLTGGPTAETCFNLANVLYSLGQYARSGERYRQVVELDPDFWEAWNNLGTVLSYDDDNEAAVAAYYRALRLNPRYADAHYNVADTLEDLGRIDEAREHWLEYLELEPHGAWAEHARERLRGSGGV
jgi:tetratricopeptide (TPR) repeat protein